MDAVVEEQAGQGKASVSDARRAFVVCEEDVRSVPRSALRHVNVDIDVVLAIARQGLVVVTRYRARLERQREELNLPLVDKLEARIGALAYCHALSRSGAAESADELAAVMAEALALRARLVEGARLLSHTNMLDVSSMGRLAGGRGFKQVAQDLGRVAQLYAVHWDHIAGKLPVTQADVQRAESLPARIYELAALRGHRGKEKKDVRLLRRKAFAALYEAYEEARAGVALIRRRQKDIDTLMPSLYAGRPHRTKKSAKARPAAHVPPGVRVSDGPLGNMPISPFVSE